MTIKLSLVNNTQTETRALRDQPLLAFAQNGTPLTGKTQGEAYEVSFDDATRNVIVLGGTGRGKTDAVLFPAASRLIETGCLGLILDAKGEFTVLADQYPDHTMLVGPGTGNAINLIAGIETPTFRAIIGDLQSHYHATERYWGMTGIEDAVLAFLAVRETGREPTLSDIHQALAKPEKFCLSLERCLRDRDEISAELLNQIESRKADEFGLLRLGHFQGAESDSQKASEQYAWQTNAIIRSLSVIVNNPMLAEAFCCTDAPSVGTLLHQYRKTMILDLNVDQYPDSAFTLARILRLQFMRTVALAAQSDSDDRLVDQAYTFLLVDEYQQYVNAGTRQENDILRDDNSWFDRSRAYGHINLVATQSISSLYAQIDRAAARTIIQNCQTTILLPTTDGETLSRAKLLANSETDYNEIFATLINPRAQGEGLIHIANHRASRGGAVAGFIRTGILTSQEHLFMNAYIGTDRRRILSMGFTALSHANPYRRNLSKKATGRIHVVGNFRRPECQAWLSQLTDHPNTIYVGIVDYIAQKTLPWSYHAGLCDYAESAELGDLVLVPVFDDSEQTKVLRSREFEELSKALTDAGAGIIMSRCATLSPAVERMLYGVMETPRDLIKIAHTWLSGTTTLSSAE